MSKSPIPGILIPLIILIVFCGNNQQSGENRTGERPAVDSLVIEFSGQTGVSIFDLTRKGYEVEYISGSMGIFLKSIDSVSSNGNFNWLCSVNDSFVQIAVDAYITNDTDIIKWHYRKF